MSDTTATFEKSAAEVPENLIKAALTHGIAGLMTQGLGVAVAAIQKAKADGLAVYITAAFMPDGRVLVLEPVVMRPEPAPAPEDGVVVHDVGEPDLQPVEAAPEQNAEAVTEPA